ncbi:hypothetical protein AN644_04160 [Candidatus Epulonipiscium fishelsonii]|nr:hypothetical protein AN644_04160 [Epulopiscium sp. SCG-C06WGA-EpuloA1]
MISMLQQFMSQNKAIPQQNVEKNNATKDKSLSKEVPAKNTLKQTILNNVRQGMVEGKLTQENGEVMLNLKGNAQVPVKLQTDMPLNELTKFKFDFAKDGSILLRPVPKKEDLANQVIQKLNIPNTEEMKAVVNSFISKELDLEKQPLIKAHFNVKQYDLPPEVVTNLLKNKVTMKTPELDLAKQFMDKGINMPKEQLVKLANTLDPTQQQKLIQSLDKYIKNDFKLTPEMTNKTNEAVNSNILSKNVQLNQEQVIPKQVQQNQEQALPKNVQLNQEQALPKQVQQNQEQVIPKQVQLNQEQAIPKQVQLNQEPIIPKQVQQNQEQVIPKHILQNQEVLRNIMNNQKQILPMNIMQNQEQNIPNNILQNQLSQRSIFQGQEQITPKTIQPSQEQVTPKNIQINQEQVTPKNIQSNQEQVMTKNIQLNQELVTPKNIILEQELALPRNIVQNQEQTIPKNIQQNQEQVLNRSVETNQEQVFQKNVQLSQEQISSKNTQEIPNIDNPINKMLDQFPNKQLPIVIETQIDKILREFTPKEAKTKFETEIEQLKQPLKPLEDVFEIMDKVIEDTGKNPSIEKELEQTKQTLDVGNKLQQDGHMHMIPPMFHEHIEKGQIHFFEEAKKQKDTKKKGMYVVVALDMNYMNHIQLHVHKNDKQLNMQILVENNDIKQFLQPYLSTLTSFINDMGYNLDYISVDSVADSPADTSNESKKSIYQTHYFDFQA